MRLGRHGVVVTVFVAVSCYSPDYGDGDLACGPDHDCPEGYHCVLENNRCYRDNGSGPFDSLFDSPQEGPDTPPQPCPPGSEGSVCGLADLCNDASTCVSGTCTPHPRPNGTECAPTSNPCKAAGVCTGGVCGAITDQPDGTVCDPTTNPCRTPGRCTNGACGAQGVKPDGASAGSNYVNRCCGGVAVNINTASNCGACGIDCPSGQSCVHQSSWPSEMYLCGCSSSSSCWSGCCSTSAGTPYVCSPSTCSSPANCINCPGNATCTETSPHYYCHY